MLKVEKQLLWKLDVNLDLCVYFLLYIEIMCYNRNDKN